MTIPDIIIAVDNCYGEFTEEREPSAVGADVMMGSLIKNCGGGIAPTGGSVISRNRIILLSSVNPDFSISLYLCY